MRSYKTILGAAMGVKACGSVISLATALGESKTDFNNPENMPDKKDAGIEDFEFDKTGFSINPTTLKAYKEVNSEDGYGLTFNGPTGGSAVGGKVATFNPREPSLEELKAADAQFITSFADYSDAAIVVVGRPGGEGFDYLPGKVQEGLGVSQLLALTTNEKDIIKLATDNFNKVVVLVNTTSPMEIEELKDNEKIDSILWIGFPENYGTLGIGDILCGRTSPSGHLYDLFAAQNMSAPTMMNMGDYTFSDPDNLIARSNGMTHSNKYVIEAENIYTGYKYYETRYNDCIYLRGNASSTKGAYASNGNWNYKQEVTYGFGYGESYADFTQTLLGDPVITKAEHDITMKFNVKVTNTSPTTSGKDVVQIYGQAPYIDGGLEKSSIQLLAYEKTGLLAPGQAETISVDVDIQNLASYDENHDNEDGTKGCYVLDIGDYYFSLGNGAHDALNNVLSKQGKSTANGMDYNGDSAKVYTWNYTGLSSQPDYTTFSVSKNGTKGYNQLDYSNYDHYEKNTVTNLSRGKWDTTYPKEYKALTVPASMASDLNGQYYKVKTTDDTSNITFNATNGLSFYQFGDVDYADAKWDKLVDQMSIEECMGVIACGGNQFRSIESVGFQTGKFTENAGNGMSVSLASTNTPSAPWAVKSNDKNKNYNFQKFASAPLVASSFSHEVQHELGQIIGEQALLVGYPILWGPGLNTHRQAYNGRNCEYYSEDAILCGNCSMEFAIGALEYGLIAAPKHFAFNDQETNRSGIAPFLTEQRARETELRAFQIAFEASKYDTETYDAGMLGVMCSFSKVGAVECDCSRGLMTNILRKEWGFHGYSVTDIFDDFDLFSCVAYAGTTGYDVRVSYKDTDFKAYENMNDNITPSAELYKNDAKLLKTLKLSAKDVLYTFSRSNLMNVYNSSTKAVWHMTWYRQLYIIGVSVSSVVVLGSLTMLTLSYFKKDKTLEPAKKEVE